MKKEQKNTFDEEETIIQQKAETIQESPQESKNGTWKSVLIGGIPGIIMGAAGTAFAQEIVGDGTKREETDGSDNEVSSPQSIEVSMAESVNDNMNFGEAFAAARAEVGAGGVFVWHGNLYNTYTAEEWSAMNDEQRQEFADRVYGFTQSNEDNSGEQEVPTDMDVQVEVQIHEVGSVTDENGEIINVAAASVEGHDAVFIDVDNDGYVDGVLIDVNDDGIIQEDEVMETPDSDLSMSYLAMMTDNPENSIYDGTPDYTNDADTTSMA